MALLLAGGCEDPNLTVLVEAARSSGVPFLDLRLPLSESPSFSWNPEEGSPRFANREIRFTGAFIRHDVFGGMKDPRPAVTARAVAWYQTINGWLLSEPRIRIFNRCISQIATNKPAVLVLARAAGLSIPPTLVTNEVDKLRDDQPESMIAKPVVGGDYCYSLADALAKAEIRSGLSAMPAIVQERLVPPEVRIYVIGDSAFAFDVRSNSLDYRVHQDAELILLPQVPPELSLLRRLMAKLGLDFGAADFKTHPQTGHLVFLELNTSPMFARFDQISGGQICSAILQELTCNAIS